MDLVNQICKLSVYGVSLYIILLSYTIAVGSMYKIKDRFVNMITPALFAGLFMVIVYFMLEEFHKFKYNELCCNALYIIMLTIADVLGNEIKVKYRVGKIGDILVLVIVLILVISVYLFKGVM